MNEGFTASFTPPILAFETLCQAWLHTAIHTAIQNFDSTTLAAHLSSDPPRLANPLTRTPHLGQRLGQRLLCDAPHNLVADHAPDYAPCPPRV